LYYSDVTLEHERGNPDFSDPKRQPGKSTRFKPGNPGKPKGAVLSKKRARKIAKQIVIAAEVAEVVGNRKPDFDGDGLAYMQAVYRGEIRGDPLRMSAAATALKFERPALAATLQATVDARTPLIRDQLTAFCTFSPAAIFFRSAAASGQSSTSDKAMIFPLAPKMTTCRYPNAGERNR
jgi:hypothetical protein